MLKRSETDPCNAGRDPGVSVHIGAATLPLRAVTALGKCLLSSRGTKNDPSNTTRGNHYPASVRFAQETCVLSNAAGISNVKHFEIRKPSFRIGAAPSAAIVNLTVKIANHQHLKNYVFSAVGLYFMWFRPFSRASLFSSSPYLSVRPTKGGTMPLIPNPT